MARKQPAVKPTRSSRRKKKGGKFSTFIGILLILVAIALFALNPIKNYLIQTNSARITAGNLTREQILANLQKDVTFEFNEVRSIDPVQVIASGVNPDHLPVIGGIAIPDLHINLPINKGTSNEGMYFGAGTLKPDQEMGKANYVLSSHHSVDPKLLFAPLLNAKKGQTIYLTDLDKIYVYEIYNVMTVPATQTSVINDTSQAIVTLVTCDSPSVTSNRVVVQGELKETVPIKEATKEMTDAFGIDQTIFDQVPTY